MLNPNGSTRTRSRTTGPTGTRSQISGLIGPRLPTPQSLPSTPRCIHLQTPSETGAPSTFSFHSPIGYPRGYRPQHCSHGLCKICNNIGLSLSENGTHLRPPAQGTCLEDLRNNVGVDNHRRPQTTSSLLNGRPLVRRSSNVVDNRHCSLVKPIPMKSGPDGVIIEAYDYTLPRSSDEGDSQDQEVTRILSKEVPSSGILPTTMNVYFQSQWKIQEEKREAEIGKGGYYHYEYDDKAFRMSTPRFRHFNGQKNSKVSGQLDGQ